MKFFDKIKPMAVCLVLALAMSGCASQSTVSSDAGNSSQTEQPQAESNPQESSDTSDKGQSEVSEDETTSIDYNPVKDGKFTLPNGRLSFTMPEGWELVSTSIAYQFSSEGTTNKFNLVVSRTDSPIEELTSEEMTQTYEATMENFNLVAFEHITVSGKPAVYMQLTGMVSQVTRSTTITQYMIQSGEDAYCFSFTQSEYDEEFPNLIQALVDSLEIQ